MTERRIRTLVRAGLLLATGCLSALVSATTVVTVKVRVVEPLPCVLNGNQTIEVNFGDLQTGQVDGSHSEQPLPYTLTCTGNRSNALKMQLTGTPAGNGFGSNVLQTSVPGLGIALKAGGNALALNGWLNFTYPALPALSAVPVRATGASLPGGDFSASATLRVEYQ